MLAWMSFWFLQLKNSDDTKKVKLAEAGRAEEREGTLLQVDQLGDLSWGCHKQTPSLHLPTPPPATPLT